MLFSLIILTFLFVFIKYIINKTRSPELNIDHENPRIGSTKGVAKSVTTPETRAARFEPSSTISITPVITVENEDGIQELVSESHYIPSGSSHRIKPHLSIVSPYDNFEKHLLIPSSSPSPRVTSYQSFCRPILPVIRTSTPIYGSTPGFIGTDFGYPNSNTLFNPDDLPKSVWKKKPLFI